MYSGVESLLLRCYQVKVPIFLIISSLVTKIFTLFSSSSVYNSLSSVFYPMNDSSPKYLPKFFNPRNIRFRIFELKVVQSLDFSHPGLSHPGSLPLKNHLEEYSSTLAMIHRHTTPQAYYFCLYQKFSLKNRSTEGNYIRT